MKDQIVSQALEHVQQFQEYVRAALKEKRISMDLPPAHFIRKTNTLRDQVGAMQFMYPSRGRHYGDDAVFCVSKQYLYDVLVLFALLEGELARSDAEIDLVCAALRLVSPLVSESNYERKKELQDLLLAIEDLAKQKSTDDVEEECFEFDIE